MFLIDGVSKEYDTKRGSVRAVDTVSVKIGQGEFVIIRGPSGSGKTTLLNILGGMLHPSSGTVIADGQDLFAISSRARSRFRADNIGFVFQMFHLVPYLTVVENVLLAARTAGRGGPGGKKKALELLDRLNLGLRRDHKPADLSAGERQRTAMARALVNEPKIILADEPTGNLDPRNAADAMGHLAEFQSSGGTVVVVTHGTAADRNATKILHLKEGRLATAGEPARQSPWLKGATK